MTTSPPLARALAARNYDAATPVQTAVLADAAADRDLLVSAQTGSGKTVAYGLAIAKNLLGEAERFERAAAPLALIVAPTRELALQVRRELAWLYEYAGARVVSCVGGMDPRAEQRELAAGAHIVVGTPGRLCDHLRRKRLDVSELRAVVLDGFVDAEVVGGAPLRATSANAHAIAAVMTSLDTQMRRWTVVAASAQA